MDSTLSSQVRELLVAEQIEDPQYPDLLMRLADQVIRCEIKTVGISGSQGSGKSTLARCLQALLQTSAGLSVAVLSLDDFYLTRAARADLADRQHPLFSVRGAPGTHDVAWMAEVVECLLAGQAVEVPIFDKGQDDRVGIRSLPAGVDVVILEGWCFGARAEPEARLKAPINTLEAEQDEGATWRRGVNLNVGSEAYQRLFGVDFLVYLRAPDFDSIHRWRIEQEHRFNQGPQSMDPEQVWTFMQFYQRLTQWMMEDLPSRANLLISLNRDHGIDYFETHFDSK